MDRLQTRLRLKARLRQVRCNQPSRTSAEAYAQMERMQGSTNGKPTSTNGTFSASGQVVLI